MALYRTSFPFDKGMYLNVVAHGEDYLVSFTSEDDSNRIEIVMGGNHLDFLANYFHELKERSCKKFVLTNEPDFIAALGEFMEIHGERK